MSASAVIESGCTLAERIDAVLATAVRDSSCRCVWCGASAAVVGTTVPSSPLTIRCPACGTELVRDVALWRLEVAS